MKHLKLLLYSILLLSTLGCAQGQVKTLGTSGYITQFIGTKFQLNYLKNGVGLGKVMTTDANGYIVLTTPPGASSYTLPAATTSIRGGIKVDNLTSFMHGDTLYVAPGAIVPGTTLQYRRGDNTWQNLILTAISDFPSPTGHAGLFLTNDGINFSWDSAHGGSGGLANAYAVFSDLTNTATATGSTTFKYRTANNLLTILVTDDDGTYGDNMLLTINQANFILAQSQITGLVTALSGKEPTITAGTTSQYYRGDKSWQTLNTLIVPESTNLYFTNARVQTFADTRYQLLTFHDKFDSLAQVNMSGKVVGSVPYWNGSSYVPHTFTAGVSTTVGDSTIVGTGDVTISGPIKSATTTINSGAVVNSKLANMPATTLKGNTSGSGAVPTDITVSGVKTMLSLDQVTNTSDANKPVSTAQATAIGLKLNTANPIPTGVVDASGATNVKLPRTTDATLQRDTIGLYQFGGGSGISTDTLWCSTTSIYGNSFNDGTDTIVITKMVIVMQGSSPNITINVAYGTTFNSGGTSLVSGGTNSTNTTTGTAVTSFTNNKIPPGNFIWCTSPTVVAGSKPIYLSISLIGYKIRK